MRRALLALLALALSAAPARAQYELPPQVCHSGFGDPIAVYPSGLELWVQCPQLEQLEVLEPPEHGTLTFFHTDTILPVTWERATMWAMRYEPDPARPMGTLDRFVYRERHGERWTTAHAQRVRFVPHTHPMLVTPEVALGVEPPAGVGARRVRRAGLPLKVTCDRACDVAVQVWHRGVPVGTYTGPPGRLLVPVKAKRLRRGDGLGVAVSASANARQTVQSLTVDVRRR